MDKSVILSGPRSPAAWTNRSWLVGPVTGAPHTAERLKAKTNRRTLARTGRSRTAKRHTSGGPRECGSTGGAIQPMKMPAVATKTASGDAGAAPGAGGVAGNPLAAKRQATQSSESCP